MASYRLLLTNLPLLLATLILLQQPLPTNATCSVAYTSSCSSINFTATSNVFFNVDRTPSNANHETYNATIIYHWDLENITVGPSPYTIGKAMGLSNTYTYTKEGYYNIGYTLIFEDDRAAGCSGNTYDRRTVLKMERTPNRCVLNAETPRPTVSPTFSSGPTVSSGPTDDTSEVIGDVNAGRSLVFAGGVGSVASLGVVAIIVGSHFF